MANVSRRTLLKSSAFGALAPAAIMLPSIARAAQFKFKIGYDVANTHPIHMRMAEAAERVKADTGGRFEFQLFPNSQLGGDTDMLGQVRSGGLEMAILPDLIIGTLVPVASITGMGFAFSNYPDVWKALDGDLGSHIRAAMAKANLVASERVWDNGFRQITSNGKPIKSPEDLRGFKIRVPSSQLWISMFKAFNAAPVALNSSELYAALQTKVVEGQENPLSNIFTQKTFEVQKFCSLTNHMWSCYWPVASARTWNAVPKDVQAIVMKHLNEAAVQQRKDIEALNGSLEKTLADKGMVFNRPDLKPFREALNKAGFYAEWHKKFGNESWDILSKYAHGVA
jgi:TRAP-type transport system periplasmic protein